ncbi:hypothetical protein DFH07DRAFT_352413 [Mycena maculata]|uniref:Uncharacterized protein n=1 Tax=Mycena maculata TaxID=230809 RepID=A0AAD7JJT9_9AGAR|nr:hypothetical protein DFH07DRAFT_352413 [Mycena maculata]
MGLIGLPLSPNDARALLSNNHLLPFERLDIPADKVRFTNPEWNAWLHREAGGVCTALAGRRVNPVYTLRKMVLEGPDSQVEETPPLEAIATMVVVLPSPFEGGDMVFDHGLQSKTIRLAPQGHLFTYLVVAYGAVTRKMCAITSGYRLTLHYDVHQPDASELVIPPFIDVDVAGRALRQAMVEWKGNAVEPAACFLKGKYPWDGFNLQLLTGPDALLVAHLVRLAAELHFQLYIAQLRVFHVGIGEYDGPYDKIIPKMIEELEIDYNWSSEEDQAFDVHSVPVSIDFAFHKADYLNGEIEDIEPEEKYHGVEGDGKLRVDQTYLRTLFLLWPNSEDTESPSVLYSHKSACHAVRSIGNPPSTRERILVESLLEACETEDEKKYATRGLCTVAQVQNDAKLLLRTLEKHKAAANLDLIGVEQCVSAFRKFGWDSLKDFFSDAVNQDASNARRDDLLVQLSQAARAADDSAVAAWCEEKRELIPRSLRRVSVAEVDWLLQLVTSHGTDLMRTVVYPQLEAQDLASDFWVHFARGLEKHGVAGALGNHFFSDCVAQAADNLLVFPTKEKRAHAGDSWAYDSAEPQKAGLIMEVVRLCVEAGLQDTACAAIFERMNRAAAGGTLSSKFHAWECYAALTRALHDYLPVPTAVVFRGFFKDAVTCMLSASAPKKVSFNKTLRACVFEKDNLDIVVVAIKRAGGVGFLKDCDHKAVLAGRDAESMKTLIRYLITELRPLPDDVAATVEYAAAINNVVRQAIDVFDTKTFQGPDPIAISSRSGEIVDMFKFCAEVGARAEWPHLLAHLASPPPGVQLAPHVSKVLVPLLPALKAYLASQNLDLESAPFKAFAATVLKAFANAVMGQRPRDLFVGAQIGCKGQWCCTECDTLTAFFSSDDQSAVFKKPGYNARQHLKGEVEKMKMWGVTFREPSKNFEVKKPDSMMPAGLKGVNAERGRLLLAVLGDEAAQKRILGLDYERVLAQVSGKEEAGTKRKAGNDGEVPRAKKGRSS